MLKRLCVMLVALVMSATVVCADSKDENMCLLLADHVEDMAMEYHRVDFNPDAFLMELLPGMTEQLDKQFVLHCGKAPGYTETEEYLSFEKKALDLILDMDTMDFQSIDDVIIYAQDLSNKFYSACDNSLK